MSWEDWFGIANTVALTGWAALVLLPRWRSLLITAGYVLPALLSAGYATLVLIYFFRVEGGGYGTLAEVKALLASEPVLLAGWVHYLAFDLFIGGWIAMRSDSLGVSRLIQAPLLAATFMFGPLGLLLFLATEAAIRLAPATPGLEQPS